MTSITTPTSSLHLTTAADQCAAAPQAIHAPFSWLIANSKREPSADLIALTLDISLGMKTCLELIHSNGLKISLNSLAAAGDQSPSLLQPFESDRLLRMAMASANLLSTVAESHIDWLNETNSRTVE